MTDDHTEREIGAYGNPLIHTPHLDRLAATGTRFQNAFCTNALCAPARATASAVPVALMHRFFCVGLSLSRVPWSSSEESTQ